jgi:OmpA-OmpF porin, OOP family
MQHLTGNEMWTRRHVRRARSIVGAGACVVLVALAAVRTTAQISDLPGSRDPSGIKRYDGSIAIGYTFSRFDEFTFTLGPIKRSTGSNGLYTATRSERAEGQRTRIVYVAPAGRSSLEVLRNYEQELAKNGFQTLYRCRGIECGGDRDGALSEQYLYTMDTRLSQTPAAGSGRPPGQISAYAFGNAKDQHLLVAKRSAPATAWISVYVATNDFEFYKETFGHAVVLVDHVESAAMESKMVTVDASTMAKDIAAKGHVALYGILFDTDKTDIKPESATAIAEIAKFLGQHPTIKLYVVGHTDNVGGYDYNIGLSQRRAAAVVQELAGRHRIQAARLRPAGSGPLAPVAPNETEDGRAKNRRVELVKQ